MKILTAYVITGNLALLFWILAIIGTITVAKFVITKLAKILKSIIHIINKPTKTVKTSRWEIDNEYNREQQRRYNEYYQSTYYLSTGNKYEDVLYNKGLYGEYKIFVMLRTFENYGARFLFNCYLPREHNETTEIDVILLTMNGIFVFESKNYNGWIYGSEYQDLWTQTLVAGKRINKTQFYNPIKQNKTHISYLKKIIGESFPIYSVVVFSNECTLKSIEVTDPVTKVIYLGRVLNAVQSFSEKTPNSMSQETLISIYDKLYPYSQVNEDVKVQHIQNINNKIRI